MSPSGIWVAGTGGNAPEPAPGKHAPMGISGYLVTTSKEAKTMTTPGEDRVPSKEAFDHVNRCNQAHFGDGLCVECVDDLLTRLREVEGELAEDQDRAARLAEWLAQAEQRVAGLEAELGV